MGKTLSVIARPLKNFNIESRAHKIISQDKPAAAPKFSANLKEAERILRENPDSMKELLRKNEPLDKHLKQVYVKSYDPQTVPQRVDQLRQDDKPLPLDRRRVVVPELGFAEPVTVPLGKLSLKQILQFLTNHQADPENWNSTRLAMDYNISQDHAKKILHYFKVFQVHFPEDGTKKPEITARARPDQQTIEENDKRLLEDIKKNEKAS